MLRCCASFSGTKAVFARHESDKLSWPTLWDVSEKRLSNPDARCCPDVTLANVRMSASQGTFSGFHLANRTAMSREGEMAASNDNKRPLSQAWLSSRR